MTFDDEMIDKVWDKAREIPGKDPDNIRQDACGTPMRKELRKKSGEFQRTGI